MLINALPILTRITLFFLVPFLMGTAIDLYVPSLPFIVRYFHTEQYLAQITISLYMLGYGIGQFFLGIISDATGRKKILIGSALLFTVVSLLAAHAANIYMLVSYRILQGIGMAGMGVMARIIAVDCYQDIDLVKMLTYYASSWAIGPVIGPVIGGYLQHFFGWQANFYYFTGFSFIVLILVIFSFKETLSNQQPLQIKAITTNIKIILSHSGFILSSLLATIVYSCLVIFNIIGPFLVQNTLHYSVISYGHIALFLGIGCFIGTLLNRVAVNYFKPLRIFTVGLILVALVSTVSLAMAYLFPINIYLIVIPVFLILFLCGLILSNMVAKVTSFFPQFAGTIGAIYGSISAGGIFIITSVAAFLGTTTQRPLLFFYSILFIISLLLFEIFTTKNY